MSKIISKRWAFVNAYTLVSDHGDVVSLEKEKPILRKQSTDRFGYRTLRISGKSKKQMVHRLVAVAFIANPEDKPEVNHKDSNPANNVWVNLEWATELENTHHSVKKGYDRLNGKHWKSKISTQDADFIREHYKNPYSAKELSVMFSYDLSTLYALLRGEHWKIHNNGKIKIYRGGQWIRES